MLYNIEFQVQQMERKVSHASGKRSLEETIELNEEIARLQLELEEHVAQNKMIVNQVAFFFSNGFFFSWLFLGFSLFP